MRGQLATRNRKEPARVGKCARLRVWLHMPWQLRLAERRQPGERWQPWGSHFEVDGRDLVEVRRLVTALYRFLPNGHVDQTRRQEQHRLALNAAFCRMLGPRGVTSIQPRLDKRRLEREFMFEPTKAQLAALRAALWGDEA